MPQTPTERRTGNTHEARRAQGQANGWSGEAAPPRGTRSGRSLGVYVPTCLKIAPDHTSKQRQPLLVQNAFYPESSETISGAERRLLVQTAFVVQGPAKIESLIGPLELKCDLLFVSHSFVEPLTPLKGVGQPAQLPYEPGRDASRDEDGRHAYLEACEWCRDTW